MVSLSFAIAALSGFAAFESVRHARHSANARWWATVGGVVLGFGIWSMHFVGMLAWVPPFPLFYSVAKTALSMVAAVVASVVAMQLASAAALPSRFRLVLGSLFVGAGICAMHYIGMSAVQFSVPEMWSTLWVAISCVIAVVASYAAMLLLNLSDREDFRIGHQVVGALVIGLAICGMHYSGMHAMMLPDGSVAMHFPGYASGATLARIGVGNALIFTFCILVISYHDRLRLLRSAHQAQIQAAEAGRTAEQLGAASRIAASIAHEVNNPLEAVTNLLYLAEHTEIPQDTREYLQQAQAELRRVAEITTHTLKFYRQQHAAATVSVPELVESVLVLFARKLETQGIKASKQWPRTLPPVYCRAGEIRQVVANLVGNAIDSMPGGGTLSLRVRALSEALELTVSDTGAGIPDDVRTKLFEPFFTTKGVGGTGLGLSISKEILERHGGELSFASSTEARDHGTAFRMILPLRMPENAAAPKSD